MVETDWMWVYENPKDAAAKIDQLREALEICRGSLIACQAVHPDNQGIKLAIEKAEQAQL